MMNRKKLAFLLAISTYISFIVFVVFTSTATKLNFSFIFDYRNMYLKGIVYTILISAIVFFISLLVGFLLVLFKKSSSYYLKYISKIFIEVMMGTPLLVFIIISTYFVGASFGIRNKLLIGILAMSLYMGPYIANAFEGAISSISKEQYIVMKLYNFNIWQKYRYVIIPQIFRQILPPMMNNISQIIKGTSLLNVIAISEIYYVTVIIQSKIFSYTEGYLILWLVYLTLTVPLMIFSHYLESRIKYEN